RRNSKLEVAGVDMGKELSRRDNLILALNSGSSSLDFGIYSRGAADTDEEPLLTGSADGIGHGNGSLHIRSSDGTSLLQRESVHESQSHALKVVAAAIPEYIHDTP